MAVEFESTGSDDKIPAGNCPDHGVVADEAIDYNFPNPAKCGICGSKLITAGMAERERVENTHDATLSVNDSFEESGGES